MPLVEFEGKVLGRMLTVDRSIDVFIRLCLHMLSCPLSAYVPKCTVLRDAEEIRPRTCLALESRKRFPEREKDVLNKVLGKPGVAFIGGRKAPQAPQVARHRFSKQALAHFIGDVQEARSVDNEYPLSSPTQ